MKKTRVNEDVPIKVVKYAILDLDEGEFVEICRRSGSDPHRGYQDAPLGCQGKIVQKKSKNEYAKSRSKLTKSQYASIKMLFQLGANFIIHF